MAVKPLDNAWATLKFLEDHGNPECVITAGEIELWKDSNSVAQPTEAEIKTWYDKVKATNYFSDEDARNIRKKQYPSIGDQLDDLYKANAFSDDMKAKIKKVKDDNPKG